MLISGIAMTLYSLRIRGAPFFFDQNEFLIGNLLLVFAFVGLAGWAIAVRTDTGWHRRLMVCAMALLTGPGFGRLLPNPLLIPWAYWISSLLPLAFLVIGMLADRQRHGAVHPAWYRGAAVLVGALLLGDVIAYSPVGYAVTEALLAGWPGAERPMHAFLPSM